MKVMTFNIRNAIADDKENSWRFRREFVTEYLLSSGADVICMQEVVPTVKAELAEALRPVYATVGKGRLAIERADDEINFVAYKKSAFTLVEHEHFWLSETPDVPGSRYPTQSSYPVESQHPRTCTHVKLRDKTDVWDVFATHLDYIDPISRERGIQLILERIPQSGKVLLCGDMNAEPNDVHAWVNNRLADLTANIDYTFNGFGAGQSKIDYIFGNREICPLSPAVCEHKLQGTMYISDHFPVWVEVK